MGFGPGDGKVAVAADGSEKAPHPLNERLAASRLDGVFRRVVRSQERRSGSHLEPIGEGGKTR